ncbi:hypothetical protein GCM10011360_30020 [Primorskyibacter flagellatus]|uniref:Uncharacterized protein n=1 Tax=Primorskyibacter flagellatus TaxID=1387277 RepID=A0A917AB40_9RHOB|nr:hypothetical protein [Primorskyibacter flagellatus]GGE40365.1 hypothetical protein GCM10011360_30020 [Primorskyibacter flagellatus]
MRAGASLALLLAAAHPAAAQQTDYLPRCVAQFLQQCDAAITAPQGYLDAVQGRGEGRMLDVAVTTDSQAQVVSVMEPVDMAAGAGIVEQVTFGNAANGPFILCHVMCTGYDRADAAAMNGILTAAIAENAPAAHVVGGELPNSVQAQMNNLSGNFLYIVTGWASDPDLIMHATAWDGEIQLSAVGLPAKD